jgi:hypothetical protein
MLWYLHACWQCVLQMLSRCHVEVALPILLWLRRPRRSQIPSQREASRALQWQQVDTLLESLRGQLD